MLFIFSAMENWGLITYRETLLLVDPNNTSLLKKQHIALTVGHEIAHQWFGNLGESSTNISHITLISNFIRKKFQLQ